MSKDIIFEDITGEPVSGQFEVSEGLITVTFIRRHQNHRRHRREHAQPGDTRKDASTADASGQAAGLKQRRFA